MAAYTDPDFTLLEEVLPTYVQMAKHLAPNKAAISQGIRQKDLEIVTYYSSLSYELSRLQGVLPNYIGSESQSKALNLVLGLFEKRLKQSRLVC